MRSHLGVAESVGADVSHRVDTLFAYLTGSANTGLTTGSGPTVGIDAPNAAGVTDQFMALVFFHI